MMVDMVAPDARDIICDAAAGICDPLVLAGEYIRHYHCKKPYCREILEKFQEDIFIVMEFDPAMIQLGAMNLILHGIKNHTLKMRTCSGK